ncbi:MAG: hypothetical protein ABH817_01440 [archaeon]
MSKIMPYVIGGSSAAVVLATLALIFGSVNNKKIGNLEGNLTANDSRTTVVESNVSGLKYDIRELEGKVSANSVDIGNLGANQLTMDEVKVQIVKYVVHEGKVIRAEIEPRLQRVEERTDRNARNTEILYDWAGALTRYLDPPIIE